MTRQVDPEFARLLAPMDVALQPASAIACGLWANGRIGYVNDAYQQQATALMPAPARWGLGASYFEPMGSLLEPFYRRVFAACAQTGLRYDQTYFCNTPEAERHFALTAYPLEGGAILTVHTLARARPLPQDELASPSAGPTAQCPHCRRTRSGGDDRWVFVSEWIRRPPPAATPRLCPPCAAFYG